MEIYQIYDTLTGFLTSNAIYQAGVFFLLWVAFRAANQVRAEEANTLNKVFVTLFSLGIIFNGLSTSAILFATLENSAYSMSQLEALTPTAQAFVDTWGTGEVAQGGLFSNPINTGWWAVVTVMLMGRIWTKQ
tara:strand:- start:2076 stop:2474 length:399 start_codon:yes stop_codon:yes gene_type:complete